MALPKPCELLLMWNTLSPSLWGLHSCLPSCRECPPAQRKVSLCFLVCSKINMAKPWRKFHFEC